MTSLATIMVFPHRMCFGTLDMRVQEGSRGNITTEAADHCKFFYVKVNCNHCLGMVFFIHKGNISEGMMVKLVGCCT